MAWTFEMTRRGYGNMWRSMAIKPGRDVEQAVQAVAKIISLEAEYRDAFEGAGMPWYFGAAIHYRESSNDLRGCMVNGEKIVGTGQRTRLVPENRGPYATFKESVQDAATLKKWREIGPWSIERFLFTSEIWNGLGYVSKGINAPFVWAGTNHEERGLYVADHVFDANTEDTRLGAAAVIKHLMEVRPDIAREIVMETQDQAQQPSAPKPAPMSPSAPQPQPGFPQAPLDLQQLLQAFEQLAPFLELLRQLQAARQQGGPTLLPPPKPFEPAPLPFDPPTAAPAPAPSKPILEKPSVQIGVLGLVASTVLQVLGVVGPPLGEASTTTGQLLPILSAGTAALGATGAFAPFARIAGAVFGALAQSRATAPPR